VAEEVCNLNASTTIMSRTATKDADRVFLRICPERKAILLRAAALKHTDLAEFVLRHALSAAEEVIENAGWVRLSARDTSRALGLPATPCPPNAKLLGAAHALPTRSQS
jgi:uncharacterized protein (DUF1778 family)